MKNLVSACSTLYIQWYRGGTTLPRFMNTYYAFISFSGTETAAFAYEAGLVGRGVEDWSCLM